MYFKIDHTRISFDDYALFSPIVVLDRNRNYGDVVIHNGKKHVITTQFNYNPFEQKLTELKAGAYVRVSDLSPVVSASSDFAIDIPGFARNVITTRFYKVNGFDKNMNESLDKSVFTDDITYKYTRLCE